MLKEWWQQLWCAHSWVQGALLRRIDIELSKQGIDTWVCRYCNKHIHRPANDPPVSFIS